jgi:predicted dithiol-disulfide oxidoreductase (DUF899 family)
LEVRYQFCPISRPRICLRCVRTGVQGLGTERRLLSAGNSTLKYDLGSEDRDGNQESTISIFTLDKQGTVRHFYSVHPRLGPGIQTRGIDEYNPIWNVLDLTPQGPRKLHRLARGSY